jgi:hypothetical protein
MHKKFQPKTLETLERRQKAAQKVKQIRKK